MGDVVEIPWTERAIGKEAHKVCTVFSDLRGVIFPAQ